MSTGTVQWDWRRINRTYEHQMVETVTGQCVKMAEIVSGWGNKSSGSTVLGTFARGCVWNWFRTNSPKQCSLQWSESVSYFQPFSIYPMDEYTFWITDTGETVPTIEKRSGALPRQCKDSVELKTLADLPNEHCHHPFKVHSWLPYLSRSQPTTSCVVRCTFLANNCIQAHSTLFALL